jgi:type II secretory pathway pseudopilin PulG
MAKKGGKKTAGIPNSMLVVGLVGIAAVVGYSVYSKRSQRQAMRSRALRRVMLARRRV